GRRPARTTPRRCRTSSARAGTGSAPWTSSPPAGPCGAPSTTCRSWWCARPAGRSTPWPNGAVTRRARCPRAPSPTGASAAPGTAVSSACRTAGTSAAPPPRPSPPSTPASSTGTWRSGCASTARTRATRTRTRVLGTAPDGRLAEGPPRLRRHPRRPARLERRPEGTVRAGRDAVGTGVLVRHDDLRDGRGGARAHDDSLQVGGRGPGPPCPGPVITAPCPGRGGGRNCFAGRAWRTVGGEGEARAGHTGSVCPPQPRTPANRCRPQTAVARTRRTRAGHEKEALPPGRKPLRPRWPTRANPVTDGCERWLESDEGERIVVRNRARRPKRGTPAARESPSSSGGTPMTFNPLEQRGIPLDRQLRNWRELNVEPIDPDHCDPYTRCRVITMNGIEVEAIMFSHHLSRNTVDPEVKRQLARVRYIEAQQQKVVNWLLPGVSSVLET